MTDPAVAAAGGLHLLGCDGRPVPYLRKHTHNPHRKPDSHKCHSEVSLRDCVCEQFDVAVPMWSLPFCEIDTQKRWDSLLKMMDYLLKTLHFSAPILPTICIATGCQ